MKSLAWLVGLMLTLAGILAAPVASCAEATKCPWLNAATAAGVLGGDVQMEVSAPVERKPLQGKYRDGDGMSDQVRMDRFDVNCEFKRKTDAGEFSISILVETMKDPAREYAAHLADCESTTDLRGIGNEAVQCVGRHDSAKAEDRVIARVRDRMFMLTITRPLVSAQAAAHTPLRDDTRNTAEQIAGSLF